MASDLYYQCKLRRGTEETVGWIEARGAKLGARVELLDMDRPKELWTVQQVAYSAPMEKAALQAKQAHDRKGFPSIGRVQR